MLTIAKIHYVVLKTYFRMLFLTNWPNDTQIKYFPVTRRVMLWWHYFKFSLKPLTLRAFENHFLLCYPFTRLSWPPKIGTLSSSLWKWPQRPKLAFHLPSAQSFARVWDLRSFLLCRHSEFLETYGPIMSSSDFLF